MDKDVAISVKNVTMSFNLNKEKVDNLKEYAIKLLTRKLEYKKFQALKDVSFEVKKGEHLAILGFNGAGKRLKDAVLLRLCLNLAQVLTQITQEKKIFIFMVLFLAIQENILLPNIRKLLIFQSLVILLMFR